MGFYVNIEQSAKIIDNLKAYPLMPVEDLVTKIVTETRVSQEVAEAYVASWRYNHPGSQVGGIGVILNAVNAHRGLPTTPTQPSPKPRAASTGTTVGPVPNESGGKVQQILALHDQGLSNDQIIAAGFNKSTVYRQVSEYKKRKKAAQ